MVKQLSRKQREIRDRNDLILKVAREILVARGYTGLTMERIAAATEYSKGTIYQHYGNKEEIVLALAVATAHKRSEMFERAAMFAGRPRERMAAVGEAADLFIAHFPDHFRSEQIARSAVAEKISPESVLKLAGCESRCMGIVSGIVRDAISCGDLLLREGVRVEEIVFGLWSMSFGVYTMQSQAFSFDQVGIAPLDTLRLNQQILLDGYGWAPLSHEWDWDATRENIQNTVFPDFMAIATNEELS